MRGLPKEPSLPGCLAGIEEVSRFPMWPLYLHSFPCPKETPQKFGDLREHRVGVGVGLKKGATGLRTQEQPLKERERMVRF